MSSFTLLSHRLFVAAVGQKPRSQAGQLRHAPALGNRAEEYKAISLELFDMEFFMRSEAARPLRAALLNTGV
jgi:hypothetical protein